MQNSGVFGNCKSKGERVNFSRDLAIDCGDGFCLFLPAMHGQWYDSVTRPCKQVEKLGVVRIESEDSYGRSVAQLPLWTHLMCA